jgi:hypothetical protein
MAELLGEEWDVSVGIISWWLGVSNLRPLAFSLEFVAPIFVSVRHASLHITLVVLVNSNALELDIIDWWLGWISVWIGWLGWVLLSLSPLAWSNTGSDILGGNALSDLLNVSGQVTWSAEVVVWDESHSVTPLAASVVAFLSSSLGDTLSEVSFNSGHVDLDWMAELSSEEWDVSGWISWLGVISWFGWIRFSSINPFTFWYSSTCFGIFNVLAHVSGSSCNSSFGNISLFSLINWSRSGGRDFGSISLVNWSGSSSSDWSRSRSSNGWFLPLAVSRWLNWSIWIN